MSPEIFKLDASDNPRHEIELSGLWQLAPYEEYFPTSNDARISGLDEYPDVDTLHWYDYRTPGGRNEQLPELKYAHRYAMRTFIEVPEVEANKQFQLVFEMLNMINTLFINGKKVGDFSIVESQWQVNVSDYIKTGKNEILPVTKDTFYAMELTEKQPTIPQYLPYSLLHSNQGTTLAGLISSCKWAQRNRNT